MLQQKVNSLEGLGPSEMHCCCSKKTYRVMKGSELISCPTISPLLVAMVASLFLHSQHPTRHYSFVHHIQRPLKPRSPGRGWYHSFRPLHCLHPSHCLLLLHHPQCGRPPSLQSQDHSGFCQRYHRLLRCHRNREC